MKPIGLEITSLSAISHIVNHAPSRARLFSIPTNGSARAQALAADARRQKIEIRSVSAGEPVLRVMPFEYAPWEITENFGAGSTLVILDHLQDPQNFGAIVRSAEAFGAAAVVIPKDRSVSVTAAVYTASAGAVETIPIILVSNLNDRIACLKKSGYWIIGAQITENATPPWEIPTFEKVALVVGTELEGLKPSTVANCDWLTKIPIRGKIDSLNVSAAAAVILYELCVRRRILADSP